MAKVLGLDVGTNSLGWALLDTTAQTIIDCGVRVFQEGVNDPNTSKEQSKNVVRRQFRLTRRQFERRRRRKEKLRHRLQKLSMMPEDIKQFYKINPYTLRAMALDKQLSLLELGRVFYHLNQRRGYRSNRKSVNADEDKGTIFQGAPDKPGINAVQQALASGNFRTLGEYLASLDTTTQRIRNRFTLRSHHEDEFNRIWEYQSQFYPDILHKGNYEYIAKKCVFFQRPLKSQKKNLGKCTLEPRKAKAPKSQPLSQMFRLLQNLNNLRIITPERVTDESRMLTTKEREVIFAYLCNHDVLDTEKKFPMTLKTELGYGKKAIISFNIKKLHGLKTEIALRKALGETRFLEMTDEEKHQMWYILYGAEHEEWVQHYAKTQWQCNDEQAEKLAAIRLEPGYMSLSSKAMRTMMPFLELGQRYDEAAVSAGYHHSDFRTDKGMAERIPPITTIRNPNVMVSLTQVRKVVNCLIDEYGKPDEIHVEMARDLKNPLAKRLEIEKQQKERNIQREKIKETLRPYISNPSRNDILRYELWKEADEHCPYTGEYISPSRLCGDHSDIDVEHILPYSRTLDNSVMNMTICVREENARKGNKTPWEMYGGNEEHFAELCQRISKMPDAKQKRFRMNDKQFEQFMTTGEGGDFLERQLHDTAYIARETKSIMETICDNVIITKGTATADLRHLWGLNDILGNNEHANSPAIKNRDDHRHHAIDAIVIALTSRRTLQLLSSWNASEKFNRRTQARFQLAKPWDDIFLQAQRAIANIIVSHKVNKRVRGALHEQTIYGRLKMPFTGAPAFDEKQQPYYVVRKTLAGMQDTNPVYKIVDPIVKETVFQRLIEKGISENDLREEKKVKIPKDAFSEPLYMPAAQGKKAPRILSVRIAVPATKMKPLHAHDDNAAFVEPGNNHHITIFERETPKGMERKAMIVSLFDAVRKMAQKQSPVQRSMDGWNFVCSLQTNELFIKDLHPDAIDCNDKSRYHSFAESVYRVQKMTDGQIAFRLHRVAVLDTKLPDGSHYTPGRFLVSPSVLKGCKVRISPIGKLELADD